MPLDPDQGGLRAPWNPDRGIRPGYDQGRFVPLDPCTAGEAPYSRTLCPAHDQGALALGARASCQLDLPRVRPLEPRDYRRMGAAGMASGTDKRQRNKVVVVRLTDDEHGTLESLSSRSGLALGAFMRAAAFGDSGPRAQRRPPADHQALRQILGHCGRIGNNLNQIARQLNTTGDLDLRELQEALTAYLDIRTAILAALAMTTKDNLSKEASPAVPGLPDRKASP